jgi:hypothetical protein
MNEIKVTQDLVTAQPLDRDPESISLPKTKWQAPRLEDVSEQVMAQPYIRFT